MKLGKMDIIEVLLELDDYYSRKDIKSFYELYKQSEKMEWSDIEAEYDGFVLIVNEEEVSLIDKYVNSKSSQVKYDRENDTLNIYGDSKLASSAKEVVCKYKLKRIGIEFYTLENQTLYHLEHREDLNGFLKNEVNEKGGDSESVEFLTYQEVWDLYAGSKNKKFDEKVVISC